MEQLQDDVMRKAMEGMEDDLGDDPRESFRRPGGTSGGNPYRKSMIVWGVGILILSVLLTLLFRGGREVTRDEIASIQARLDRIEKQLTLLSGMEQRITHLEEQEKTLEQSTVLTDNFKKALTERLDKMSERLDGMQETVVALNAKKKSAPQAPKQASPQAKGRYHQVRQGETLYGIAKRYGTSVSQLRHLNHLTTGQAITPGQRLLVSPK